MTLKIAFILGTFILALGAYLWKDLPKRARYCAIVLLLLLTGIQIYSVIQDENDAATKRHTGELKPQPGFDLNPKHELVPTFQIGSSNKITFSNVIYLGLKDCPLKVVVRDGRLFVSTLIRNKHGDVVAEIVDNEWKVAPPPRTFDRNYTDHALEVKDASGDVVLQIVLRDDIAQIQGKWYSADGAGFAMYVREDGEPALEKFPSGDQFRFAKIRPMFKYPSELHPGQYR
jgi:hypothetical protein